MTWEAGQSGNPRGRPKIGMTLMETINLFAPLSQDELEAIHSNIRESGVRRAAAARLLDNSERGKLGLMTFQELMDRSLGKPAQSIDLNVTGQINISAPTLTAALERHTEVMAQYDGLIAQLRARLSVAGQVGQAPLALDVTDAGVSDAAAVNIPATPTFGNQTDGDNV